MSEIGGRSSEAFIREDERGDSSGMTGCQGKGGAKGGGWGVLSLEKGTNCGPTAVAVAT